MSSDTMANDIAWQVLEGLDPATATFPARAKLNGESFIVFQTGAEYRGVQRTCPHLNASLIDAQLMANGTMLRCAQHNYTFRLRDGKGVNCPGFRIKVFEVKQDNGAFHARPVATA
jgi:nitrite reductase/ring-hydroxylating ferredoxin subunit